METTWGPSGGYGDNMRMMGTMGMMWGRCGDDRDDGDNMWRPQTMETTWGPFGGYGDNMRMTDDGDDMGMTGTMWVMTRGRRGPCGDNKITKNAITLEPNRDNSILFEDL